MGFVLISLSRKEVFFTPQLEGSLRHLFRLQIKFIVSQSDEGDTCGSEPSLFLSSAD